jgi:flagellar hook-associated protein 1 FlgK
MRSTFSGLELARRALESQQAAIDITGHNIANTNTAGYSRQITNLQQTIPLTVPSMGHNLSVGTGVTVGSIERARDIFVDRQYRWENSKQQYWAARQDTLVKIEGLLNEPSDNSLHTDMDKFWNAWSDLSKNPENMGARSVVLERAASLADTLHHIDQQITEMQKSLDTSVRVQVNQINMFAKQIQDLNMQIKRAEVSGDNPNDLKDKRDAIVDELSQLVNVRVVENRDPEFKDRVVNIYKVYIGDDNTPNQILVDDTVPYQLETDPASAGTSGLDFAQVKWAEGHPLAGDTLQLGEGLGKLSANLQMRGSNYDYDINDDGILDEGKDKAYLSNLRKKYDDLAAGLAIAVNAIHESGKATGITYLDPSGPPPTPPTLTYTADPTSYDPADYDPYDPAVAKLIPPFFTADDGTISTKITAANIKVNTVLTKNSWMIATGKSFPGDGEIAMDISTLSSGWAALADAVTTTPPPLQATSFGDFYGAAIAEMGVDVQQADRMKEGQDVLVNHMFAQRENVSGVSLDEEMANLVRFQKSYSAAARIVTMMDDMLDTLVNRMGVTR